MNANGHEVVEGQIVPIAKATPISVLQRAVESGANVETLAKLLELQERWEKNEARKAFDAALAEFKADPPKLEKVKHVDFASNSGKRVDYHYAPLDYICTTIGAALSKHGLSFTWNVDQSVAAQVKVTCILRHKGGHSESVTMVAGLHDDTRMNAIQRLGATITYLERYSVLAATGLATADQDTDGMTMGNAADFLANIQDAADMQQLETRYKEAIREGLKGNDPAAVKAFMAARVKRESEIKAA